MADGYDTVREGHRSHTERTCGRARRIPLGDRSLQEAHAPEADVQGVGEHPPACRGLLRQRGRPVEVPLHRHPGGPVDHRPRPGRPCEDGHREHPVRRRAHHPQHGGLREDRSPRRHEGPYRQPGRDEQAPRAADRREVVPHSVPGGASPDAHPGRRSGEGLHGHASIP